MDVYIFGAKATAAGLYRALITLELEKEIKGFLVSDMKGNPPEIWGCPVMLLDEVSRSLSDSQKRDVLVYVAVPELIHKEIKGVLEKHGFDKLEMIDSRVEADIMERYFQKKGQFLSVHSLPLPGTASVIPKLTIYAASFYKDKPLDNPLELPAYVKKLYLGCDRAVGQGIDISGKADYYDNTGDNISSKNPNWCEMTAHYWIWKNRMDSDDEYVGVCHYRRTLDLSLDDLKRIKANDVDVILPFPMIHYPDSRIHHTWYVPEKDWELAARAVGELYPDYAAGFDKVFGEPYFYNYNILLAKKKVFADYCAWLYPVLDRIEELSGTKAEEREDRYMGYVSESLATLYFMVRRHDLKICHTGRMLCT